MSRATASEMKKLRQNGEQSEGKRDPRTGTKASRTMTMQKGDLRQMSPT